MARKIKKGLSFYPLDVCYFEDDKIVDLTYDKKLISELVFIHTLSLIYKDGYYIEATVERFAKKLLMSLHGEHDLSVDDVISIINKMADIGLLDKELLEQGIITSKAIQKQYYACTIRRKEREKEHWLLADEDEAEVDVTIIGKPKKELSGISVYNNDSSSDISVCESTQNKNKKKKKNEIDKEDKYDKGNYPGYLHYCTACLIEDKFLTIYDPDIPKFNELFDAVYREYGRDFEFFHRCFTYCRDYVNRNKENIDDKFNYFKVAFTNSMEHMEGYDERMQNFREAMDEILRGLR